MPKGNSIMTNVSIVSGSSGETLKAGPIQIRVLEDGSRTDNRLGAVMITIPPKVDQIPAHLHRMHDETFLVISGKLRFSAGKDSYDVAAGGYVVVPIGASHKFTNPFDEPAEVFNSFTPAYYVNYLREISRLETTGQINKEDILKIMARYATEPA
jgi:quercetin dioxygenase-like cupin family protein